MKLGGLDYLIQQNWVNASGGYCALSLQALPALTSISPNSGAANSSVAVAIAGMNLSGGTINISGTGITASNVTSSATQITATFVVAGNAAAGSRVVTVTTAGSTSNAVTFTVYSSAPSLTVSVNPNNGTGLTQTFSAVYTDAAGSGDLAQVNLLFNTSTNGASACWVYLCAR